MVTGVPVLPYDLMGFPDRSNFIGFSVGALVSNLLDSSLILQTPVRAYLNFQILLYHTIGHMSNLIKKAYITMTYRGKTEGVPIYFGQFPLH